VLVDAVPSLVRTRAWPSGRDFLLPLLLAGWVQVDVWGSAPFAFGHMVGPRAVVALLYAVTSLALGWRRKGPLVVLAFVVTADTGEYLAFGAPQGLGSILPLFFAFWSVGRHSRASNLAVAAPLVLLGIAVHERLDPAFDFSGFNAFYWLVLSSAWPLGYAFRRRAAESEALAASARELVRDRDQSARAAVDAERERIARELHDVVGHGLSVIVLQLVAAQETLDRGDATLLRDRLQRTERSAREALAEMRRLLDLLHQGEDGTPVCAQPGLGQLERLAADTRAAGATVELAVSGAPFELPTGVDLALFRILQESLTNVLKHAEPPDVAVLLTYRPDGIELEVRDRGRTVASPNPAGHGLAGMRERVALYSGELDVGPLPEGGFRVRARLPVPT
jgi:signal transduction histidine kinase